MENYGSESVLTESSSKADYEYPLDKNRMSIVYRLVKGINGDACSGILDFYGSINVGCFG